MKILPILIITVGIIALSCSSKRRTVAINSSQPAEITFAPDIKSLVIIDRTKFKNNTGNVIEGILTGEMPEEDKAGVQAFISSMNNRLTQSPRFIVKTANMRYEGNSLTTAFPNPLTWGTIDVISKYNGADIVVAVEIYDTDFMVTNGVRKVMKTVKTENGSKKVEQDEFFAEGNGNIVIGVRIYDPKERTILDEKLITRRNSWDTKGRSEAEVISSLITKTDATRNLSSQAGYYFANRLAPMSIRLSRSFIGKSRKAPSIEQGSRYADVANWEEAIKVWKQGLNGAPEKQAGILAYNIAVGYEVLEDFDKAIEWAQKAYTQYGHDPASGYIRTVKNRLNNERIAEQQLQ